MAVIRLPEFDAYGAQCAVGPFRPLRVTAIMDTAYIAYNALHFDSILSAAVVALLTDGRGVPSSAEPYAIPLPLQALWTNADGLPLWASTDLMPVGEAIQSQQYFHRRALNPWQTTRNIDTGAGRHKEKRVPLPTITANSLSADVLANGDMLADLLSSISSFGKKRTSAGRVREWLIDEIDEFSLLDAEGRARRPVPLAYLNVADDPAAVYVGFTPPYWHAATRALCYDSGMRVA